jgi:predicted nucleic acid-binding protein
MHKPAIAERAGSPTTIALNMSAVVVIHSPFPRVVITEPVIRDLAQRLSRLCEAGLGFIEGVVLSLQRLQFLLDRDLRKPDARLVPLALQLRAALAQLVDLGGLIY